MHLISTSTVLSKSMNMSKITQYVSMSTDTVSMYSHYTHTYSYSAYPYCYSTVSLLATRTVVKKLGNRNDVHHPFLLSFNLNLSHFAGIKLNWDLWITLMFLKVPTLFLKMPNNWRYIYIYMLEQICTQNQKTITSW